MKYFWYASLICILFFQHADATPPPMVEKHLFAPNAESEKESTTEVAKAINPKELQRQIIFSGVIIGPKGKKALIRESGGKPADSPRAEAGKSDAAKNKLYAVGEQIKGMTIKDIGSNYLVLAGQEGETRLNLYRGEKSRPAAPVIAQETTSHPPQSPPQPPGVPGQPNSPGEPSPPSTPTTHDVSGPGAAGPGPGNSPGSSQPEVNTSTAAPGSDAPPANPFAEVMKKAAERRANRPDQPSSGGMSNPFMNLPQ